MKLWQSALITAAVSVGSVLVYRDLFEPAPTVVVMTAPAPQAAPAPPPPPHVVEAQARDDDDEPEQADPPPPCKHHSGRAATEEDAQELFEEAVATMRNKDMSEGCCLLEHIVDEAPDESIWVTKAENLLERRCDDEGPIVPLLPPLPPAPAARPSHHAN